MNRYLFKNVDGLIQPAMPTTKEPDGVTLLTLEQAAIFVGIDVDTLRKRWHHIYGEIDFDDDIVSSIDRTPAASPQVTKAKVDEAPASAFTFAIGRTSVFNTFVTTEKLARADGKEAMGLCLPNEKRILISSHYPTDTWADTWLHEARHAWHSVSPRPDNEEAAIDWETTVSRESHGQFHAQGGLDGLRAMTPVSGRVPADFVKPGVKTADPELLLRRRFSHLNDEQFEMARQMWIARRLNPWADQFYIRLETRGGRKEPRFVMKINGLRALAERSPSYRGHELATFTYKNQGDRYPASCLWVAKREIGGVLVHFPAEAFWSDAYGDDMLKVDALVLAKPLACLQTIAESMALRIAFPTECADIYVEEELSRPVYHAAAARVEPGNAPLPSITLDTPNDFPGSSNGMRARLRELGFKTPEQQRTIIKRVEQQHGPCQDGLEPEFYARVIAVAKQ